MPAGSSRWWLSSSTARASSIHELSYLGGQGQNQLYRGGPGQVHEDFQAEEACNFPAGVVFHQGQCSGPHCSYGAGTDHRQGVSRWLGTCFIHRNWHPQADHRQGHPDDWAPALFTETGTRGLLLIPNGKEGAGRPLTDTGDLQEKLGGGCEATPKRTSPPPSVNGLSSAKLCVHRQRLCQKKFRKKFQPNFDCFFFIFKLKFDFEHTS